MVEHAIVRALIEALNDVRVLHHLVQRPAGANLAQDVLHDLFVTMLWAGRDDVLFTHAPKPSPRRPCALRDRKSALVGSLRFDRWSTDERPRWP